MCSSNYTGANCEIDAPCNESPCENGAVCENSLDLGDYSCACLEPDVSGLVYTGKNCDVDAVCNDGSVCQNGGECLNSEDLEGHALGLKIFRNMIKTEGDIFLRFIYPTNNPPS